MKKHMQEYSNEPKIYESKRVILITGDASKWYEQAIFIVKKNIPKRDMPMDFMREAEGIIEGYMNKTTYAGSKSSGSFDTKPVRNHSRSVTSENNRLDFDFILNVIIFVCCVSIIAILAYQFM